MKLKDIKTNSVKPTGLYQVEIVKVEAKESSVKKTPFYNFWLKIVDGEYKGQFIFTPLYLSAKSIGFMKRFLEALEFSEDYDLIIEEEKIVIPIQEFEKGQQLVVLLDHEKGSDGEEREKVTMYKSLKEEGKSRIEIEAKDNEEEIPF